VWSKYETRNEVKKEVEKTKKYKDIMIKVQHVRNAQTKQLVTVIVACDIPCGGSNAEHSCTVTGAFTATHTHTHTHTHTVQICHIQLFLHPPTGQYMLLDHIMTIL
jgi:hypothetical protein